MKNRLFAKVFVIFLVLIIGMSSGSPFVLCFGEDGHVKFEIPDMSMNNPLSAPISNQLNYCSRTDEEFSKTVDCGDCFDLLISTDKFLNKTIKNNNELFSKFLPIVSIKTLLKTVKERLSGRKVSINESNSNLMLSIFLEKVILLV